MSQLSFLAPAFAFVALLALPIVLLYLLRQKRPDMQVSSTLLWSKTLADMRASTPFQKLRRNLLLLLQLLILAALVLTLMRPITQAKATQAQAGVIVIDATASMQTHDDGATESRLDCAKSEAKKLVARMRPGDQFMLIADGGGLEQVRSGFSSSKSELDSLIDSVKSTDTASDLSESLLLAATSLRAIGAQQAAQSPAKTDNLAAGQIWLFSDGSHLHLPDILGHTNPDGSATAGGELNFIRIGSSDHSVGITQLSITPLPKQDHAYQVFVGLKNAWSVDKRVGVLLALGDKNHFLPDQAKFVTLPANGTGSAVFENVVADPGPPDGPGAKLFARVDDTDDDFPLDNTAYGILAAPRKTRVVLITPPAGNAILERVIQTAVKVGQTDGQILSPEFYNPDAPADLFIFDGFLPPPDKMPKVDTLLIAPKITAPASGASAVDVAGFHIAHTISNPAIISWKREDPLLQYVEFGDLHVGQALLMEPDSSAVALVSAPEGPLIAFKDFGSVRRYLVSFDPLLQSNWWQLPSLLIFMQNAIDQTRVRHFIGMPQMVASGTPATLWSGEPVLPEDQDKEKPVRVILPDGGEMTISGRNGVAIFGGTDKVGIYEAQWPQAGGGTRKSYFAVNLLSATESDIRPQALETAPGSNIHQGQTSVAVQNKEIWQWFAAAALLVLLVEWWIYHRRIA